MRKFQSWISCAAIIALMLGWFSVAAGGDSAKININTASAEQLLQLKGIGEKKAASIIEFREKQGPFETPEDLLKVPGIGIKTLEANKENIDVK